MTEYPELSSIHDIRIDTSVNRPQSGGRGFLPEPTPRYSRHGGQTPPRVQDVTWMSMSHSQPTSANTHTPQSRYMPPPGFQQVRTPTPMLRKSVPTISESDLDAEYMTVSVDDRDECNYKGNGYGFSEVVPVATNGKSEKRNFVGGFVSGLRRLPKVMSKSRLRDHNKLERHGTSGTLASTSETGRMGLPRYTGPGPSGLGIPKTNSDDIPTVERLETPRDSSVLHPPFLAPRPHDWSHNTSTSSRPFEREEEVPNAMSTPILAEPPIQISSPILAEPRPSADFAKMESPIRPPPAESVASQLARVRRFFRDLNGLPWIASRGISDVYLPGQSEIRRRYSRPPRDSKSWYTPRNTRTLDLLAGPSTTGLLPTQQPIPVQSQLSGPAPFILGSSANLLFSQPLPGGGSRSPSHEGPPSTDSHGSQAPIMAPAYVAQPLFVYPSGLPQPGGSSEAQLPRPVYMVASSSPHFMTSNDGGAGPRLFVPQLSGLRTPTFA
ncbi:hypothetical protein PAXRUDRAFT_160494 [Paxillus rubicundulus Ve08.2h10]|uniref:Uncharacterized protein n=1 Tax=Paxillus rubicundulus Ve08.2h10 TaxID=930991 RepID=A0A0D0DFA8_9AGAM|nr:hypothetical protein PAXRUDRAFT_160494 [Paxillus rubicundulus Ve08.2h10]